MNYFKISIGIFIALAASRFIPHPPNFTSLLALSFYVPALLGVRYLPALVLSFLITDLFIGFFGYELLNNLIDVKIPKQKNLNFPKGIFYKPEKKIKLSNKLMYLSLIHI